MQQRLKNKVAVITGSTSGIGEASAFLFSKEGAKVVVSGRNKERGLDIVKKIVKQGGDAFFIHCDVSDESSAENLINSSVAHFGRIDILFNNAGIFLPSVEIERLDTEDWLKTFQINLDGCFYVTKFAKKFLIANHGSIINTGSIAGQQDYAAGRSYAYSASKSAIIQFTRMMAKNYAEEGIRVNCISPGVILTPILHGRDPQIYAERIPMKRVGTPEEVAKVAVFLASDEASYLTGVVIPVDGGASL